MKRLILPLAFLGCFGLAIGQLNISNPFFVAGTLKPAATGVDDYTDNMLWWLKADSLGAANDAVITSWTDSSPNGINFSQDVNTQSPTNKTSFQNGLPAIRFDGANDHLTNFLASNFTGSNLTIVAVVRRDSKVDQECIMFGAANGGADFNSSQRFIGAYQGGTGDTFIEDYRNGVLSAGTRPADDATFIWMSVYSGTNQITYINGSAATGVSSSGSFNIGLWGIGSRYTAPVANFNNYYYMEVRAYSVDLNSVGKRTTVETALNSKWAVY